MSSNQSKLINQSINNKNEFLKRLTYVLTYLLWWGRGEKLGTRINQL